jgi:hypothetical protein
MQRPSQFNSYLPLLSKCAAAAGFFVPETHPQANALVGTNHDCKTVLDSP